MIRNLNEHMHFKLLNHTDRKRNVTHRYSDCRTRRPRSFWMSRL